MAGNDGVTRVNLGIGTLVLIAMIVMIFGGGSGSKRELRELRAEVAELRKSVEAQSEEIRRLGERLSPAPAAGAPGR